MISQGVSTKFVRYCCSEFWEILAGGREGKVLNEGTGSIISCQRSAASLALDMEGYCL